MKKFLTRYLRFGTVTDKKGQLYDCQEYTRGIEVDNIRVVSYDNKARFDTLRYWANNSRGLSDDEQKEMEGYVISLPCEELEPVDEISFVDSKYNERFRVRNLSEISINGYIYLAVKEGKCHTTLCPKKEDGTYEPYGYTYHNLQMGELADKLNWTYFPAVKEAQA